MNKPLLLGALASLSLFSCAKASSPAMADLRALDKDGSKKELVDRLGLVAPSERDDEWFDIAQRGGAEYLAHLKVDEGRADASLAEADALLEKYPKLATSKTFMSARLDLGVKAFKANYGQSSHSRGGDKWISSMVEFAQKDAVTDAPSRLAKDVVLGRLIPITAYPLFDLAVQRDANAACSDAALTPVFVDAAIAGGRAADLAKLLSGPCASKRADLTTAFNAEGRTRPEKRALCEVLGTEGELKSACEEASKPVY